MPAISGDDPALMYARLNVMRLGASRLGWCPPIVYILINGVDRTLECEVAELAIRDELNGTPNTATVRTTSTFIPLQGQQILISLGSTQASRRLFAGHILTVTPSRIGDLVRFDLSCTSYEWRLQARKIWAKYTNLSATAILRDLIGTYASGFTARGVEAVLPIIDEITFTAEDLPQAIARVMDRIGGDSLIDETKDLVAFLDSQAAVHSLDDGDIHGMRHFVASVDLSQVKTRVLVEGNGSQVPTLVSAGETILPVDDVTYFSLTGGMVTVGPQRVTYLAASAGGGGALVGPGASPSSTPAVARRSGTGIDDGVHAYAVRFNTASGHTPPGPIVSLTHGIMSAPSSAPTVEKKAGGGLSAGVYAGWKYTFVDTAGGETTGSSASDSLTMDDIADPASIGTASQYAYGSSGTMDVTAQYSYVFTLEGNGVETLPSPKSNNFSTGTVGGLRNGKITRAGNTATPADFNRKWYRTVGGSPNGPWYAMAGPSDGMWNDDVTYYYDGGPGAANDDASLGALAPTVSTAVYRSATIHLPVPTDPNVASIRIYRPVVGGSTYKLSGSVSAGVTSYLDDVADGSLGATLPSVSTAAQNQTTLTGIPLGPSGTVSRTIERTDAGGSQLKDLMTILDNATTTAIDTTPDSGLGSNAPTSDTTGFPQPDGTVNAGSTTLLMAGTGAFESDGGWAIIGNGDQIIRYTGVADGSLTGIPTVGAGAITASISYNSTVTAAPQLMGIAASGDGSIRYAVTAGDDVRLLITRDAAAAQTALAALIGDGDDGIREEYLQDNRLSQTEAEARGDAKLAEVKDPLVTITYETQDVTTRSGKAVSVNLGPPTNVVGTFTLQRVTITFPGGGAQVYRPWRTVEASSRRLSFEALLRLIKAA